MQLHRLAPSLQSTQAAAHANMQPVNSQAVTTVLEFLAGQPWPARSDYPQPTPVEAGAELQHRYQQFLLREPYVRPKDHHIPKGIAASSHAKSVRP
jgi:hypothetical protein